MSQHQKIDLTLADVTEQQLAFTVRAARSPQGNSDWVGEFSAMASPCQVLFTGVSYEQARYLTELAYEEAKRIETKFSRYCDGNIIWSINNSHGDAVVIDNETWQLLKFADQAHTISQGLFDITSGILRNAWHFDGCSNLPKQAEINELLPLIHWSKLSLLEQFDGLKSIKLKPGVELDFGGFGKEYAVDRVLSLLSRVQWREQGMTPILVNFGGDIATNGALFSDHSWTVGVEPVATNIQCEELKQSPLSLRIPGGALATSGDARKYLKKDGIVFGHILNPKTGWPVKNAPRSVSVCSNTCLESGLLSTLAILQGAGAEAFLKKQNRQHWLQW